MSTNEIKQKFKESRAAYEMLGQNIVESISILLKAKDIKFLSIYFRIKTTESFMEKIERKEYKNPLSEIEDICGIRIVCYYLKDIPRIVETLQNEFKIHESFKKEKNLDFDRFGYRSHHIIASVKKAWTSVPNYRGMEKLKCEIQIRTVLMHAWAEIEHNLAYKSESQAPEQFRRKLHRISAKLEEADEQFEELKTESLEYQKMLVEDFSKTDGEIDISIELNLDSLQAFLDTNFATKKRDIKQTAELLEHMNEFSLGLKDLQKGWEIIKPNFNELEVDFWQNKKFSRWSQVGVARITLDLTNKSFRNRHKGTPRLQEREALVKKYVT